MPNLLIRKEFLELRRWLHTANRKPLVVRGARQVGKSTLVRQFAEASNLTLLEINFERNPEYREAFVSNNPATILSLLGILFGKAIDSERTLLFLDEIQSAPEVLPTLRYFYEEMSILPVIAAGSLLEFTLADARFSMPVGRIEYLHLGPMQFSDFLVAMGERELANYLENLPLTVLTRQSMPESIHNKCLMLLRQFLVVGGLPEAVSIYASTGDFFEVTRIHQSITSTYRDDFSKYANGKQNTLVRILFDKLPTMIGQKFKYANVSRDYRAAEIESALQQLCLAKIAMRIYHSSANGFPLGAEVNERHFKPLFLDVGLQGAALKISLLGLNKNDLTLVNSGALAEQFIGQHLAYSGPSFQEPTLYYWMREARGAAAELDYLMPHEQQIIPVEIKSGTSGTLKSLHQFLKEKNRKIGLRFNADKPSLLKDTKNLTDGSELNYRLLSLPLYMVEQAQRLLTEMSSL